MSLKLICNTKPPRPARKSRRGIPKTFPEPVPALKRKRQPTETAELGESLTRALLTLAVLKTTGMGGNG